jgi:hypothetical protein
MIFRLIKWSLLHRKSRRFMALLAIGRFLIKRRRAAASDI